MHADQLRPAQTPRFTSHDVDCIGASYTDGQHCQPAGVWGVRVGADHHRARKCVVFQDNLVNDTGARLPEADSMFFTGRTQEVINFRVVVECPLHIFVSADSCLNQVIAVHS